MGSRVVQPQMVPSSPVGAMSAFCCHLAKFSSHALCVSILPSLPFLSILQSQPFWLQSGTRDSTSVFEETKPSATASILRFRVFCKHTEGGAPARLITAISNSNTTKGVHILSQSVPVYATVPKKLVIATPPSFSGGDDIMVTLATAHISCFRKPPSN